MGAYRLLLDVAVEHEFFADGVLPGLRLVPTQETATLLGRPGLALRASARGVRVLYDDERVDTLGLLAADGGGGLDFAFKAYCADRAVAGCSDGFLLASDAIVHLDSKRAVADASGRRRLHAGERVTEADLVPLDDDALATVLDARDRRVRPMFTLRLRYGPKGRQRLATRLARPPDEYVVRFAARRTYWKYYLLGSLRSREVGIVDLDGETSFEPVGVTALADERPALAFRSTDAIALRERATVRFQLREQGNGSARVLVRRLPVAATGPVSSETVKGRSIQVSEIYVND